MTTTTMRAVAGELRGEQATCDLENLGGEGNFLHRLMDRMGWTRDYARRAIAEYQRYCELAGSCGHPVTPSAAVDQVWHLHLLDTRHYWQIFCPNVLGRELHHTPSRRGRAEAARYHEQYAQTLRSYQRRYGRLAPPDIWPPPRERFAYRERIVDSAACWIIPKALLHVIVGVALLLATLLLAPDVASAASGDHRPPDSLFWSILVCAGIAALWRLACRERGQENIALPDQHEALAFLASGEQRATDVVVARLLTSRHLQIDGKQLRRGESRTRPGSDDRIGQAAWDALATPLAPSALAKALTPNWHALAAELRSGGELCSSDREQCRYLGALVIPIALVILWQDILQLLQHSPASVFTWSVFLSIVVPAALHKRLGATWQTRHQLDRLKNQQHRLRSAPCDDEQPLAIALFGVQALAGTALAPYLELRKQSGGHYSADAGCGDAGGDGGGGCSGDGGGCGGCGGCG